MTPHKLCAVVPVYNHGGTVAAVVAQLAAQGLPCVLVDDGSAPACAAVLDALAERPDTHLVRRPVNGGKGAAVLAVCPFYAGWISRHPAYRDLLYSEQSRAADGGTR